MIIDSLMSERKAWSQMEDGILKDLYEKKGVKRWSEIARIMECEFHIRGRNGKQCRERYHNHLDDSIRHCKWTPDEEQALARHHDQLGNRWAELSRFLPGRSENDIKNQFYSILRRGLRHINAVIRYHLKRYKELEVDTLYRITEEGARGKRRGGKDAGGSELKQMVMSYAFKAGDPSEEDAACIKKFIQQVKGIGKTKKKDHRLGKEQPEPEAVVKLEEEKEEEKEGMKEEKEGMKEEKEGGKEVKGKEVKGREAKGKEGKESEEEIESQEYRDNCPVVEVKKEAKFRKSSFFNFTLEQPEMEMEVKTAPPAPYKLRKRSSIYSNHSFDLSSPRWNQADPAFKAFEMPETDNFSPKPQFYATSPYFDQSKNGFWSTHEFH